MLEQICGPSDLKKLNINQLTTLCQEIREHLVASVTSTGGHLASNLGVVELTVALHYVFDIDDKSKMNLEKLENILDYKEFSSDKTFSWIGYLKMLRNIIVLEVKNNNISLEKINYYQKKYKDVKWFYEHLEFLKGENKNGNN